jgi:hypothetical protein
VEFKLDEAVEVLEKTPKVMSALLRGRSDVWLHCRKSPDAFSPLDVIGHLIHAELTDWIPRARQILDGDGERLFDPFDRFDFKALIAGKTVEVLLDEFAKARSESLHTLGSFDIGARELEMRGTHPEFGAVTLSNLLATWVVHDLGHIAQVVKTMSSAYGEAVGPWRAYLSILK